MGQRLTDRAPPPGRPPRLKGASHGQPRFPRPRPPGPKRSRRRHPGQCPPALPALRSRLSGHGPTTGICRRKPRPPRCRRGLNNAARLLASPAPLALPHRRNRSAPPMLSLQIPYETRRSEEHTSELQSLMRISYAVLCLQKKNKKSHVPNTQYSPQRQPIERTVPIQTSLLVRKSKSSNIRTTTSKYKFSII